MAVVYLCRKEKFSAAHRLHSNLLNEDENARIFGKCNSVNGHGHNYELIVTVRGVADAVTGMLMNLTELKQIIQQVLVHLDHRNLDLDVEYFRAKTSTTENLCVYIWNEIEKRLARHERVKLYKVQVHETELNSVWYMGEQEQGTQAAANVQEHVIINDRSKGTKCFKCGMLGHIGRNCRDKSASCFAYEIGKCRYGDSCKFLHK
jgi:6-pyruvoyltetrahydropterin/6-carboxytetrahydropterin synthase